MLRLKWRGLETEPRLDLHGHERGNPGDRQGHDLTGHRASPRPDHVPQGDVEEVALLRSYRHAARLELAT